MPVNYFLPFSDGVPENRGTTNGAYRVYNNPSPVGLRRRDLQGFLLVKHCLQRPAMAALARVQECGEKDLVSPQARWGDDGARQVREARDLKILECLREIDRSVSSTICSSVMPSPDSIFRQKIQRASRLYKAANAKMDHWNEKPRRKEVGLWRRNAHIWN